MKKQSRGNKRVDEGQMSGTILVIEDDQGLSRLIQGHLERLNFNVERALSGAEAIEWLASNRAELALLDYSLPDMTGSDLIEALAKNKCSIPFIVVTGRGDEALAVEMMKLGARDYMVKDTTFLDRLPLALQRTFEQLATERKLAEAMEELRMSEEKYRLIAENVTDVIFTMDTNLRFTYISPSVTAQSGYGVEEAMARGLLDTVTPESLEAAVNTMFGGPLEEHVEEEVSRKRSVEVEVYCKDGSTIWLEVETTLLHDAEGEAAGTMGVARDVTERRRAEESLRESEEKLRITFESMSDAVIIADPEGRLVQANEAAARMTGYTKEELVGRNALETMVAKKYRNRIAREMTKALGEGHALGIQSCAIVDKGGREFDIEFSTAVLRDSSGKITNFVAVARDVTERKRAEEEKLQAITERAAVIDAMGDGLITIGMDGKILSMNPAFKRLSGYNEDEFKNKDAMSLIPRFIKPEEQDRLSDIFGATLKGDIPESKTFTLLGPDGWEIPILATTSVILDQEGKPATMIIMLKDITYIKQAEEALRESEEKYRLIAENVTDVIFTMDMNLRLTYISPSVTAQSGYSVEEAMARGLENSLTPASLEVAMNTMLGRPPEEQVEEILRTRTMELETYCKDGSTIWIEVQTAPLYNAEGKAVGVMGVARDITERRRSEEALRESEEKLRITFESMRDAFAIADPEGRFVQVNEATARMTGYTKEELVGRNVLETMIAKKHRNRIAREITKALAEGDALGIQSCAIVDRDGREFDIEFSTAVLRDSAGNIINFVAVARDVTERRRAEEALRENEEKYRNLFEGASDGIFTMELSGEDALFTDCNSKALTMFECNLEDIIGKSPLDFSPQVQPDGRSSKKKVKELAGAVMAGENKFFEWSHRRLDGTTFEVEVALSKIDVGGRSYLQAIVRDVTDRKRAEGALRESEERYRLFAENVSDVIWTMDMDLRFTYISPSTERMRGYSVEESMAQSMEDYLSPQSLEVARQFFAEELAIEETENKDLYRSRTLVLEQKCKDGSTIWTESKMTFLRDSDNKAMGILGVTRDVTDRKRAEEARLESEERYRAIFSRSLLCVYVHDFEGNFIDANDASLDLLGYSREEISSLNFASLLDEEQLPAALQLLDYVEHTGSSDETRRFKLRRKDGDYVWVETEANIIYQEGKPYAVQGIAKDITESKRAEEAIRDSEAKLNLIFQSISDGIIVSDLEGKIIDENEAAVRLQGYSRKEEVIGRNGFEFIAEKDRARATENAKKAAEMGYGPTHEYTFVDKDGREYDAEASASLMRDSSGNAVGFISVFRDITERRRAEEEKLKAVTERAAIVDAMGDGLVTVGMDGKMLSMNPAMERLTGYNKDEFINKDAMTLIPRFITPEEQEELTDMFMDTLKGDEIHESKTFTFFDREGRELSLLWTTSLILDQEGKPAAILILFKDITYIKEAEEALRRSEEKYRTVLETIEEGYYEVDLAGNLTFFNDSLCRINGYPRGEMMGMNNRQYMSDETAKAVYKIFNRVYRTGKPARAFGWEVIKKDGTKSFVEGSASLMRGPSGEPVGFRGVIRDITERKRAEEELRESEEKLRVMFESITDGIIVTDLKGTIVEMNDAAVRMSGISREEIIGKDGFAYIQREDRDNIVADGKKIIKEDAGLGRREYEISPQVGGSRTTNIIVGTMHNSEGKPTGFVAVLRDVTERKKAEEALKASEEKLRAMFESITDGIVITDLKGTILDANDAVVQMSGMSREELIGRDGLSSIPREEQDKLTEGGKKIVRGETGPVRMEHEVSPKVGRASTTNLVIGTMHDSEGKPTGFVAIVQDITERKKAEIALRESEEKLRLTFESISDGIVVTDLKGKILDMNAAAVRMSGMSREEVINKDGLSLLKRKEHKDFMKLGEKALQGDTSILSTGRKISPSFGNSYDADLSLGTLHDNAGSPTGYVAVVRDVTERKQAQEALRESQKRLQEFFDSASDLMQTVAPDGRLLWVNRTWREILGYTEEDITALSVFDIIHPDSLAHCKEVFQRVLGGEVVGHIDAKFVTKEGREIMVEGSTNCRFENNKPDAIRGLFHDVTERKRAEEALRESEEKMRVTFESMSDAVAVIDLEGHLAQVNEAAARMTGYTKEELVGRNVLDTIIAERDRDKIVLDMTQTLGDGDALGVRAYTLVTKNGREFDTEFSTAVLRDGSGNITNFVGVARDVTERKRAEEERERLLHELERSNAELQQFAHVASHDLQEPLRMVASYTQLLEKRYKGSLDADADDFIAYAVDGAKRMQNLIQGLLSYSRVGSRGKPFEQTECESVFEQAMANLKVAIDESGAEVTHDPLPRVMADETQLIQLFQNLMANAIKFRNEKQPRIHISAKEDSQEFLFSVNDNGIGISPEYFERIFVIFQRLHGREEYPGTGIGLSVCKRIVERHGGRIWVESQPGEGSTFYFTIPRGGEEQ